MALGQYKVPAKLQDEDKWFKIFTKRQLAIIGVTLVVAGYILITFSRLGLFPVGYAVFFTMLLAAVVISSFSIPEEKYLLGGGERIDVILIRIIRKRIKKNRVIYVKHYTDESFGLRK